MYSYETFDTKTRKHIQKGDYKMAVFKIKYFDTKDDQEHEHEIKYNGPEMPEADTWMMGTAAALGWCKENNVCLISITNICM